MHPGLRNERKRECHSYRRQLYNVIEIDKSARRHFQQEGLNRSQGGLIGELNKQPSVIMFTFTSEPCPHAHTACVKPPPPC